MATYRSAPCHGWTVSQRLAEVEVDQIYARLDHEQTLRSLPPSLDLLAPVGEIKKSLLFPDRSPNNPHNARVTDVAQVSPGEFPVTGNIRRDEPARGNQKDAEQKRCALSNEYRLT